MTTYSYVVLKEGLSDSKIQVGFYYSKHTYKLNKLSLFRLAFLNLLLRKEYLARTFVVFSPCEASLSINKPR